MIRISPDWSSGARQRAALAAFGALPALWEDREGEWEEQDGSTKHLAMPSERPLDSGGSPGSGGRALSPRQTGVKAAQDGEKRQSSSHPAVTLERARVLGVCSSVTNESSRVQSPTHVQYQGRGEHTLSATGEGTEALGANWEGGGQARKHLSGYGVSVPNYLPWLCVQTRVKASSTT